MTIFSTPSLKHERVPKIKRYCTNCRRDQEVALDDELCPICHEATLLPPSEKQRREKEQ